MSITNALDFFIQWHLTERCNLRCRHCYQGERRGPELGGEEAAGVIEEVADTLDAWSTTYGLEFSPSFNVTGGEPLLREDLFSILEKIARHGFAIHLLSNGILIDRNVAAHLAALPVRGVQVSIEGPPAVHDAIRGVGTCAEALAGVDHLLEAGLTVTLNVTLSTLNAASLPGFVELARARGVQRLGFSRLVPWGRGAGLSAEMLDRHEVRRLYEEAFAGRSAGLEMVSGDPLASQMQSLPEEDGGGVPRGGCAAGYAGLTILSDGTLTPCRRLPVPLGNIRQDSLREIWAVSPVLTRLRDRAAYPGRCGRCPRWSACRGCRAIAYAYSRGAGSADLLADDPQCFIDEREGADR